MLNLSQQSIRGQIPHSNLYTLRSLQTPRGGRILARILMAVLAIFLIMLFLPWQQNIRGNGAITALDPMNRPQTVESIIGGQIRHWYVKEGDYVKKGDTLVTINEVKEKYFDPLLLSRLGQQITSKENSLASKQKKVQALRRQVEALKSAMALKLEQLKAKVSAEKIRFQNAENQFVRNKKLYEAANIPLTKFQDIEYKYQLSQSDYLGAQLELNRTEAEYLDKISKTESELNGTQSEIFETEAELTKARNEYSNTEIRNGRYNILAPQDGYVVKAVKAGIGETLKEGEAVVTIMPESKDLAVEMYVKAMDVPLISKDRKVRIQFDGWPALQFSGWPSVSVGTFGGIVKVIDYVNSKPGEFRILVVPDQTQETWPAQLRNGSGTKGWVMLDDVPVWYELWRQLNGFPPSLYASPQADEKNQDAKQKK